MKICPRCRRTVAGDENLFCAVDGARLVEESAYRKAEDDPLIGTSVDGRYQVLSRIGVGGVGTVYRAHQVGVGRDVALKVLRLELADKDEVMARFQREARAASRLHSPHVVRLFDFGQDDRGMLFMAMELLVGEALSTRLEERGAMPWGEAVAIAAHVNEALREAHGVGIIHRDLKPGNIFITAAEDGGERVKVLDFGLTRFTGRSASADPTLTKTGMVIGTPLYMSPEQAMGRKTDLRSDFYSLGVTLFEMLTGRPPFRSDNAVLLLGQHIHTPPPTVLETAPESAIPEELDHLVESFLAKDPADRPQTAEEVREHLSRFVLLSASSKPVDPFDTIIDQQPPRHDADEPSKPSVDVARRPADDSSDVTAPTSGREREASIKRVALVAVVAFVVAALFTVFYVLAKGRGDDSAVRSGPDAAAVVELVGQPPTGVPDASSSDAAAPIARSAMLEIRTTPTNARVFVDGLEVGASPLSKTFPRDGARILVEAKAPHHRSASSWVSLHDDVDLNLELEPLEAKGRHRPNGRHRDAGLRKSPPSGRPDRVRPAESELDETNPYRRESP